MKEERRGELVFLVSEMLRSAGLTHAFTTRVGGASAGPYASLNLAFATGDSPERVKENRASLAAAFECGAERLATVKQVLGSTVQVVASGSERARADAMVTDAPGLPTLTLSADCALALVYDPRRRVIANVHASRLGTHGRVARNAVAVMIEKFNCDPRNLVAAISPSIGPCCYRLRPFALAELYSWWREDARFLISKDGGEFFDMWQANRSQLIDCGIPESSIDVARLCTACRSEWFYSYRRDGDATGRFGAFAVLE